MSLVSNNPYESPQVVDEVVSSVPTEETGLLATVIFGVWAGVFFGGTFGVGGSLLLGLSRGPLLGWDQAVPSSIPLGDLGFEFSVVAIIGAISGVACGVCIGPLVGLLATLNAGKFRRAALVMAITLSTTAGALLGHLGCGKIVVGSFLGSSDAVVALIVGTLIGALCGLLGGRLLGRGILAFAK